MSENDRLKEVVHKPHKKSKGASVSPEKKAFSPPESPENETEQEAPEEAKLHEAAKEIEAHVKLYDPIREGLLIIKENVERINRLKQKDQMTANEKARKENLKELEKIMSLTTAQGAGIRKALDEIKELDDKYAKDHPKDSAKKQVRSNMYYTNLRKFRREMNEYNEASTDFKQALQDRTRRQLKIVSLDISDQDIDKIIETGNAEKVMEQAVASDNLRNVIQDIEERHEGIKHLEHQVLEVYELFKDLATLVELQQESFDIIEDRIKKARDYAVEAETQLTEAAVYHDKARKRLCCLIIVICALVIIVLVPTLTVLLKKRR